MKKRIFALVLALLMICSVFPISVSADTVIRYIEFTNVVMPVAGETPVHRGALLDTAAMNIVILAKWCKYEGGEYTALGDKEVFEAGKKYYFRCVVAANDGYQFDAPLFMNASMYDAAGNYISYTAQQLTGHSLGVMVSLELTCQEAKQVDDIDIKNVVLPVPGEKSDNSGTFVDEKALYFATKPLWCKLEGGKYVALTLDETFEEGKTYYYRCVVNVKPGYKFNPMNLYMNGSILDAAGNHIKADSILIENDDYGKRFTMGVKCAELKQVDDIDFKDVVLPLPGETPDRSGTFVDPDALYFVTPVYWCKVVDGKYNALADDEKFEEGRTYYFRCRVNVKPGYKFNPMNISLNGSLKDANGNRIKLESILIEADPAGKLVTLGVTCAALKQVDDIDFKDVVMPVAGETPDRSGTFVDADALYFVTPVYWCKVVDGKYTALADNETFEGGKTYYYRCLVNVKPGYKFNPMNISLNGSLKDAAGNRIKLESILIEADPGGKRVTLGVKCAELKQVDDIDFKDVVKPVAGEKPNNAGTFVDADALYFVSPANWCKVVDGKYTALGANETFEGGKTYYYRSLVNVKPGYKFNPMNISLNGSLKDAKGNSIKLESILIENEAGGKRVTLGVKCEDTFMLGDVNGDKQIKSDDARLALRAAVKLETFWNQTDNVKFKAADIDKNKKITADDARHILRAAVKLEDPKSW